MGDPSLLKHLGVRAPTWEELCQSQVEYLLADPWKGALLDALSGAEAIGLTKGSTFTLLVALYTSRVWLNNAERHEWVNRLRVLERRSAGKMKGEIKSLMSSINHIAIKHFQADVISWFVLVNNRAGVSKQDFEPMANFIFNALQLSVRKDEFPVVEEQVYKDLWNRFTRRRDALGGMFQLRAKVKRWISPIHATLQSHLPE